MLLQIPEVLSAEVVGECRKVLEKADWVDGRITAGHQSARAKDNLQLPEDHEYAKQLGDTILVALEKNPLLENAGSEDGVPIAQADLKALARRKRMAGSAASAPARAGATTTRLHATATRRAPDSPR